MSLSYMNVYDFGFRLQYIVGGDWAVYLLRAMFLRGTDVIQVQQGRIR